MTVADEPALTVVYHRATDFKPAPDCVYLFARSVEERSEHVDAWRQQVDERLVTLVEIQEAETLALRVSLPGKKLRVLLRSESSLATIWDQVKRREVYIDITGFPHHVWAPLLRSALKNCRTVNVVYVEPEDYKHNPAPMEGQIFDLSERIEGVAPLPGFAFLGTARDAETVFVPLLGFEGTRLAHLLEQVQPSNERIIPVIGVPGFRPEYPFHAFLGNKRPLEQTRAWQRVRFATANCPFSVFYLLEQIASDNPRSVLQVAPIGTKPHALGAILFKIISGRSVEIIYDYPTRKPGRTRGTDHLLVYHVSAIAS